MHGAGLELGAKDLTAGAQHAFRPDQGYPNSYWRSLFYFNVYRVIVATLLLVMVVLAIFACGLVIMITGVRLTWAMSRDERFPGWQQWNAISPTFRTPLKATVLYLVVAELILAIFEHSETALFTLFGAATLLPAVMYAATVVLYLIKRKSLPVSDKFNLGAWEIPVLVVAVVWLVFELALFRDSSFKQAWAYVIVMVVIGPSGHVACCAHCL